MKAIFEFDLTEPGNENDFICCSRYKDAFLCISSIQEYLRKLYKYSDEPTIEVEKLHTDIYEIINSYNLPELA